MEGYSNAGTLNGSSGNSAPVGGRRHSRKGVKKGLRLVKKKTVRALLARKGWRMRGGAEPTASDGVTKTGEVVEAKETVAPAGGRRHRKTAGRRKSRRSRSRVFGLF
jgi:hypothetical protein